MGVSSRPEILRQGREEVEEVEGGEGGERELGELKLQNYAAIVR